MTNSNPSRTWWGRKKPVYQDTHSDASESPADTTTTLPAEATPLAPPWPTHPVANRLYAENQMFIDQANRACEQAALRGY